MQLRFTNLEIQAKLEQWSTDTGRPAEELVQDVMADYFDELAGTRTMLDSRYDDIKSGKVKLIPGDDVRAQLMKRIESRRKT